MTRWPLRRLALWLVFAAGIASILATSRPGHYFRDVAVEPAVRCPNTDLRVAWTLNQPAPVALSVGATEFPPVLASSFVIPAGAIDDDAPAPAVVLAIDAKYAEYPRTIPIRTIRGSDTIEVAGVSDYRARHDFVVDVWPGAPAVIDGVNVYWPWETRCDKDEVEREISWKVTRDGKTLAILRPETGYESALPAVSAAPGPWTFSYTEEPTGRQCKPGYWDENCPACLSFALRPPIRVWLKIRCTG